MSKGLKLFNFFKHVPDVRACSLVNSRRRS